MPHERLFCHTGRAAFVLLVVALNAYGARCPSRCSYRRSHAAATPYLRTLPLVGYDGCHFLTDILPCPMPARPSVRISNRPVLLPARLPAIMIAYLRLIVALQRQGFTFATLSALQTTLVRRFLAQAPYPPDFPWRMPGVAENTDAPLAFRQMNFQLPGHLAIEVDRASVAAGVSRSSFLYSATFDFVQHVAAPAQLGLA